MVASIAWSSLNSTVTACVRELGRVTSAADIIALSNNGDQYLPDDLASFAVKHPGIKISLEEERSGAIVEAVQTGAAADGITRLQFRVKYQGCADVGVCYPPHTKTVTVDLPGGRTLIGASPELLVSKSGRQVVANPLISLLGPQKTVHSRLTFAQAFNSLGTTVFPIVGSALILGGLAAVSAAQLSGAELEAYRTAETRAIVATYLGLAAALAVIALAVFLFRNRLKGLEGGSFDRYHVQNMLKSHKDAIALFIAAGSPYKAGPKRTAAEKRRQPQAPLPPEE